MNQNASSLKLLNIWNRGVYLARAGLAYAPQELKSGYNEAHAVGVMETLSKEAEKASEERKSGADFFQSMLWKASAVSDKQIKAREALEAFVSHHLLHGNLIGYGFEPPRKMDSQPFEIPRECWHGKIDWSASKLSGQGLVFNEVRLITPQAREVIMGESSEKFLPTRPQGRPSVGPSIEAAFKALLEDGKIDTSASQGSHYPQLRAWLALNVPDLKTPADKISDKTLYRHFSPLFRRL